MLSQMLGSRPVATTTRVPYLWIWKEGSLASLLEDSKELVTKMGGGTKKGGEEEGGKKKRKNVFFSDALAASPRCFPSLPLAPPLPSQRT